MSAEPAPKKARKAKKARKRAEEEPREPSRVLNIRGLPHGVNPLESFHDMITELDDDIVKIASVDAAASPPPIHFNSK